MWASWSSKGKPFTSSGFRRRWAHCVRESGQVYLKGFSPSWSCHRGGKLLEPQTSLEIKHGLLWPLSLFFSLSLLALLTQSKKLLLMWYSLHHLTHTRTHINTFYLKLDVKLNIVYLGRFGCTQISLVLCRCLHCLHYIKTIQLFNVLVVVVGFFLPVS